MPEPLARAALDALALVAGTYSLPAGIWSPAQRTAAVLDAVDALARLYQADTGAPLFPAWLRRLAEPLPGGAWGSGAAAQWIKYHEDMIDAYRFILGRYLCHDAEIMRETPDG